MSPILLGLLAISAASHGASPTPPRGPGDTADKLRATATRAYRTKDYATACPLFERALALAPHNAAIAADLGVCLMFTDEKERAIEVSRRAILLAHGDAGSQVRRNAYFNLGRMQAEAQRPAAGCPVAYARSESGSSTVGSSVETEWWNLRIMPTADSAADAGVSELPEEAALMFEPDGPKASGEDVLVQLRFARRARGSACRSWLAWNCDQSQAMEPERERCRQIAAETPDPLTQEKVRSECIASACEAALESHRDGAQSPVVNEIAEALGTCWNQAARNSPSQVCSVVHEDACTGLVGVFCDRNEGKGGQEVHELRMRPIAKRTK